MTNPWDPVAEPDMHAAWEQQQPRHVPWNQPTNGRGWLALVRDDRTGPATPTDRFDPARTTGRSGGYAQVALEAECDRVANATYPGRNHVLNRAAFSLGQLVAGGELERSTVERELTAAAQLCGLNDSEIGPTIASGLRAGAASPRTVPEPVTSTGTGRGQVRTGADSPGTGRHSAEETPDNGGADEPVDVGDWVREHLPRLNWQELWDDESTEDWIVEPILPARRLVALYSAPKVGKSLLMLEMAVGIAKGDMVLGVTPDRPRRVLYIDFENDPKGDIRERLTSMGYKPADLENLVYLSFPILAALDSATGAGQLMAAVETYGCEVVVIDTVSRAIKGEENENDTWLDFYRHTGKALKRAGVAMIRLDHTGKDETRGQRGGSAKSGDVDAVWRMSKVTDDTFRLDCEANRMPVMEKTLVLHRENTPYLRHRVDAAGRVAAFRAQEDVIMAALEEANLPGDAGRDKAREVLKAANITASNGAVAEVLRRRKASMGISFDTCPRPADRGTDVRLSAERADRYGQADRDGP